MVLLSQDAICGDGQQSGRPSALSLHLAIPGSQRLHPDLHLSYPLSVRCELASCFSTSLCFCPPQYPVVMSITI